MDNEADATRQGPLASSMTVVHALAAQGALSPAELAQTTGLPRSTVYRLVAGLTDVGLVIPAPEGRARLSTRWLHLADIARAAMTEWQRARAALDAAAEETGQTAFLTVRHGNAALCIDWSPGSGVGSLALAPGGTLPLHVGGAGRLLLAWADDREDYLSTRTERLPWTTHTLTDADDLRDDIYVTRTTGRTLSVDDATEGIGAVAVPVFDGAGDVRGCVSLAGGSEHILTCVPELQAAATRAAAALGG